MALSNEAKESILQAMDIIANKASSQVNFDSTIKGFIVNNDNADNGEYTIGYENTKFIAYSENTSYAVDDCVRVSIPNNDFSEKKYILGKCVGDSGSEPITYTSIANTILEITSLIDSPELNIGLEANNSETSTKLIPLRDISQGFEENEAFNVLFLEASFQSSLDGLRVTGGTYGLQLSIYNKDSQLIHSLSLDSSEFFGDPYCFSLPVRQSKKLNISDLAQIGSFVLTFYQNNDFFYYENGELKPIIPIKQNNIFIKSVKIGLGTDLSLVEDNTIKLYCKEGLEYDLESSTKEKNISLLWYNKTEDNTYVGFSDGIAQKDSVSYQNYDETTFLNETAYDNRLNGQLTDEVPTDEISLSLRANIFIEGQPAVQGLYTTITKELNTLTSNFATRMQECDEIKKELQKIRTKSDECKAFLDSILNADPRDVYETLTFEKGKEVSLNTYENIVKLEVNNLDPSILSKKIWKNKGEVPLNQYFNSKYEKDKEGKEKIVGYIAKETIRARIKIMKKVDMLQQQYIDFLRYGFECEQYKAGKNPESTYPDYSLISTYYTPSEMNQKTLITSVLIKNQFENANKKQQNGRDEIDEDTKETIPLGLCDFITQKVNYITDTLTSKYKSFAGIWTAYKPKFLAIVDIIKQYIEIVDNYIPSEATLNNETISIKFKRTNKDGEVTTPTLVYNLQFESTAWKSSLVLQEWENRYSIYWYRNDPGYVNKEDKIISKDWERINLNFGLPNPYDDKKVILYWDKRTTGDNLPRFNISTFLRDDKREEKFKVVIIFNHNRYESDELVFSNIDKIVNLNLAEEEKFGFYIDNGANSKDNYQEHYNFTNQLISSSDSSVDREVVARFKDENGHSDEVFENSWIYWYVPDGATMINYDTDALISKGFSTDKYKTVRNVGYCSCESDTNADLLNCPQCNKPKAYYYSYSMEPFNADFDNKQVDFSADKNRKVAIYTVKENWSKTDDSLEVDNLNKAVQYGCIDEKEQIYIKLDDIESCFCNCSCDDCNKKDNCTDTVCEKCHKMKQPDNITDSMVKLFHPKDEEIYYYEVSSDIPLSFSKKSSVSFDQSKYYFGFVFEKLNTDTGFTPIGKTQDDENPKSYQASKDISGKVFTGLKKTTDLIEGENLFLISPPYNDEEEISATNTIYFMLPTQEGEKTSYKQKRVYIDVGTGKYVLADDVKEGNNSYIKKGIIRKGTDRNPLTQYIYKLRQRPEDRVLGDSLKIIKSEFNDSITNLSYYKFFDNNDDRDETQSQNERFLKKSDFAEIIPHFSRDGYYCFYKYIDSGYKNIVNNKCTNCEQNESSCKCPDKNTALLNNRKFTYQIKPQFNQDAVNNNIMCAIEGNSNRWNIEQTLVAKNFFFGTYGANGTEYSVQVVPERAINNGALTTTLHINLYNGSGEEQNFPEPSLSWVGPTSCNYDIIYPEDDGKGYKVDVIERIHNEEGYDVDSYFALLKITIRLEKVELESFYPIPYTSSSNYYIDGTTAVVYNSFGSLPGYTLDSYRLWNKSDGVLGEIVDTNSQKLVWDIHYIEGTDGQKGVRIQSENDDESIRRRNQKLISYLPTLQGNLLSPKSLFIDNVGCYATVVAKINNDIVWAQPIAILQNRFSSTTLNNWDNKFQMDEEGSTILAAMLGAGKKEIDNSFSGVLMGDVKTKGGFSNDTGVQMGLYGFNKGAASFGFKVDGTAFLGKSGKGRILFNGDQGYIASATWNGSVTPDGIATTGSQGMLIDLENGHIDAHDFRLTSGNLELDSNPLKGDSFLCIGDSSEENPFLKFTNDGELKIKVTNFELTYHSGQNLLKNTAPLDRIGNFVAYDQAWYATSFPETNVNGIYIMGHMNGTSFVPWYTEYSQGESLDTVANTSRQIKLAGSLGGFEELVTDITETNINQIAKDDIAYYRKSSTGDFKPYEVLFATEYAAAALSGSAIEESKYREIEAVKPLYLPGATFDTNLDKYFTNMKPLLIYCIVRKKIAIGDQVIFKTVFNKYFETKNQNNTTTRTLKQDVWARTDTQIGFYDDSSLTNKKYFLPTTFESSQTHRKCMKIDKKNYEIHQDLNVEIGNEQHCTLSGWVWFNNSSSNKNASIEFILTGMAKSLTDTSSPPTLIEKTINQKLDIGTGQDWKKFKLQFYLKDENFIFVSLNKITIKDNTDHNVNSSYKYTLFHHLKLERGLCSTPWNQSEEEDDYAMTAAAEVEKDANAIFSESLTNAFQSSAIFDALTDGGKKQGIYQQGDKFYICAETIGVGLLRSHNAQAKISYQVINKANNNAVIESAQNVNIDTYNSISNKYAGSSNIEIRITAIEPTAGILFDLNSGYLGAGVFELDAWSSNKGLYLNSHPDENGTYKKCDWIRVGRCVDTSNWWNPNNTFIRYYKSKDTKTNAVDYKLDINIGKGKIQATDFDLNLTADINKIYKTKTGYDYQKRDYKACSVLAKTKRGTNGDYTNSAYATAAKTIKSNTTYDATAFAGKSDKDIVLEHYNLLSSDEGITNNDASAILNYVRYKGQQLNLAFNPFGLNFKVKSPSETKWQSIFSITPAELFVNNNINITTQSLATEDYYFIDGYNYTEGDANNCQAIVDAVAEKARIDTDTTLTEKEKEAASGAASKAINKAYIKAYNSLYGKNAADTKTQDEIKSGVLYYYDVNGDSKLASRDAKLIRKRAIYQKTYGYFKMNIQDSGIYCYRTNIDNTEEELLMSIDYAGVYIKEYTDDASGSSSANGIFSYGTNPPGKSTKGYGKDGSIYFKII